MLWYSAHNLQRHCSAWCVHVPQHIKAHSQHFCHSCKADDKQADMPKGDDIPKDIEMPSKDYSDMPKDD